MHMDAFLWMFLPVFVAGGSALLSFYVMQARMEVALARERESLAEARAAITSQKVTLEDAGSRGWPPRNPPSGTRWMNSCRSSESRNAAMCVKANP